VHVDLAEQGVRQQDGPAGLAPAHQRNPGLIARGFNSEDQTSFFHSNQCRPDASLLADDGAQG
jgi:hypothetical protein